MATEQLQKALKACEVDLVFVDGQALVLIKGVGEFSAPIASDQTVDIHWIGKLVANIFARLTKETVYNKKHFERVVNDLQEYLALLEDANEVKNDVLEGEEFKRRDEERGSEEEWGENDPGFLSTDSRDSDCEIKEEEAPQTPPNARRALFGDGRVPTADEVKGFMKSEHSTPKRLDEPLSPDRKRHGVKYTHRKFKNAPFKSPRARK